MIGATVKGDNLVGIDASGKVVESLPLGGMNEPMLAMAAKTGDLWVADAEALAKVDEDSGALRKVATFPAPADPETPPHIAGLQIDASGKTACVELAHGTPYAMGEEEEYKAWQYSVNLSTGALSKKACSAHAKPAKGKPVGATFTVVKEASRCGLMVNTQFFSAPLARERSGGGCQITVQPALSSGRFQPVYALVGGDDAMQLTYVLYMVDLAKGALVDLSALSSDWERYQEEGEDGEPKKATKGQAPGLAVYLDLESKLSDAETLPWRASATSDKLFIMEAVLDLSQAAPTVVSVGTPFVFLP